jgi:hypothetical protein
MNIKGMTPLPGGLNLMPCAPDVCQECAVKHDPEQPHNQQSLYYQYKFYAQHGRWPTWADAMAHCDREVREYWISALRERGIEVAEVNQDGV